MSRRLSWSTVAGGTLLAISAGVLLWPRSHVIPHKVARPSQQRYAVAHPVSGLRPSHMSPLLRKETTLLAFAPSWEQHEWIQAGRPPLFWSPQDGQYYFAPRHNRSWGNVPINIQGAPFANLPPHFPKWYGQPIHP